MSRTAEIMHLYRNAVAYRVKNILKLLDIDLDESLERYVHERVSLVERLKTLSPDEWRKTAVHEAFDHYSVFIMFRHVLNHEMLHAYRIEELLLKKDWE